MTTFSITLKSVYSCPADTDPADIKLPPNWRLMWHQAETLKALRDPQIDIVFNTAMTGDGKSLAAYLDVLQGQCYAMGLYPTNALARDQETQIQDYIAQFQPDNEPRVNRLSGPELEVYAENEGLRKSAAIATRASQSEVLITNPDIFHYLHHRAYLTPNDNPDKLWNSVAKNFDLFIFDEFHVSSPPQVASILNIMLLIRATNRSKKFLFLSATPSKSILKRLESAEFRCRLLDPVEEEKYKFPDTEEDESKLITSHWRKVAHPIKLNFIQIDPISTASENWLKDNQEIILDYFLEHRGSKGAIILNSIASVKRLTPVFKSLFSQHGLTVCENTGLSGNQEKFESLEAHLVIGTSTIDVGVDFKINFLIFESADSGNFIQRLGRLGRHAKYIQNGQDVYFQNFTAYALVPTFFLGRLFKEKNSPLESGKSYNRIFFQQIINEQYRKINNFEGYYTKWGSVQSFRLWWDLNHPNIRQAYEESRKKLRETSEAVFKTEFSKVAGCIKGWANDWYMLSGKKGNPIAEDAFSFRDSSPFQCGIYDLYENEKGNKVDSFKIYNLPGILGNLEIKILTKKKFMEEIENTIKQTGQFVPKGRFQHCVSFMELKSYREEREDWKFTYPGDLLPIAQAYKVQVLTGLQIWQPGNRWISQINKQLSKQGLVSYVLRYPVHRARGALRLPLHFQIYPISDQYSIHESSPPYSIAFSHSALMLDTVAYWQKSQGEETWIA